MCNSTFGRFFGHKFQAIYDETESENLPPNITSIKGTSGDVIKDLKDSTYTRTYVYSICTRCGEIKTRIK